MPRLGASSQGESRLRMLRIVRRGDRHDARDLTVSIRFEGDFATAFREGRSDGLIPGETLKSFVERERLFPPELAALVIQQLARALAHAHEAGVIHRDLKPENVMVRDDGVLKLMDFGIARVLDPAERMTVTGALVGSPAYMAPEVIDGQPATAESDVFSLGTLLYWLWTGTLPFAAPSTPATLKRILAGTYEDPRGVCPAISDALVNILDTCLAHDPVDRYASARELEQALSQTLDDLGLTDGAKDETKARYAFVYGDFRRLHRMGIIACHYRAAEWGHKEIELAAHELLQYLDDRNT